ncbi:DNA processing protein [Geodermatophilus bullaregiensis]|uniref:DNA-processing protein DprA n=1 Tax=Geodermatophilus bullaregiensis TaxID=1564160 RepID=UPI001956E649|nr:DNA-processing protein DprA [Geodermatophilus bullaregiensis]MBM7805473.1 DNA processing protein [Geodermatophilus bullaregiensis]
MTAPTLDEDLEEALAGPPAVEGGAVPGVRRARAWLTRAAEPGSVGLWRWVDDVGPVAAVRALRAGTAPEHARALVGARAGEDGSLADLRRAERCGARLVVPEDDEWPALPLHALTVAVVAHDGEREQADRTTALVPPVALWVRGTARLDEVADRSVAVVGARASTAYGEHVAAELGHQLGERGWTVVSGGAHGIDAAAHRGALAAGAPTVAVLACGVDRPYPVAHSAVFARIVDTGGLLVSEWPPGAAPHRHRFLVRNRLIAGLTRGTVVVEAAARSGAQATARRARGLGKEVLVVPGPVTSAMSVGCHELLRDEEMGARLVTGAAQVVEAVGGIGTDLAEPPERLAGPRDGLSDLARRVLDACPVRAGVSAERLAAVAGCDPLEALRVLPALELADLVQWTGTGWRLAPPPERREGRGAGG